MSSPEQLESVKAALFTLAQESGIPLTAEEAEGLFAQLHAEMGAISDEELDSVAGGFLATMEANGDYDRLSEMPMPKSNRLG